MQISDIEKQIKELEEKKKLLQRIYSIKTDDVNELVYIKYIQLESVTEVAREINKAGYRIKTNYSERKYISNDISEILCTKNAINDGEINLLAKELFKMHKKAIAKRYF